MIISDVQIKKSEKYRQLLIKSLRGFIKTSPCHISYTCDYNRNILYLTINEEDTYSFDMIDDIKLFIYKIKTILRDNCYPVAALNETTTYIIDKVMLRKDELILIKAIGSKVDDRIKYLAKFKGNLALFLKRYREGYYSSFEEMSNDFINRIEIIKEIMSHE